MDVLEAVQSAYLESDKSISNAELYQIVKRKLGISNDSEHIKEVGEKKVKRNLLHRKCRWIQQSLKEKGILTRVGRGDWEIAGNKKIELQAIKQGKSVIAMSTTLGVCLWSKSDNVFENLIDDEVHLVMSSPPYPLKVARAYGNVAVREYVDFIIRVMEPIVDKMAEGANLVLNVSNDIFEDKSPARSTYLERLIIAIEDRLGLSLMDRIPWVSNKAPGPYYWASIDRTQLNVGYEPVIWFCNSPRKCLADNRRVLQPHSDEHMKFMSSGGTRRNAVHGDGAYIKREGAYSNVTEGKIPKNVLQISNYCHSGREVNKYAKMLGLPAHAAKMPLELARFFVNLMLEKGKNQLAVDPFGGTLTLGEAAEEHGSRWICTEMIWQYIRQSFVRFRGIQDVWVNPHFVNAHKNF